MADESGPVVMGNGLFDGTTVATWSGPEWRRCARARSHRGLSRRFTKSALNPRWWRVEKHKRRRQSGAREARGRTNRTPPLDWQPVVAEYSDALCPDTLASRCSFTAGDIHKTTSALPHSDHDFTRSTRRLHCVILPPDWFSRCSRRRPSSATMSVSWGKFLNICEETRCKRLSPNA